MTWKKSLLIKIHLYCGLFTSFYLLALGFSSLVMNHDVKLDNQEVSKTWKGQVDVDPNLTNEELAESVRSQLDLMGWLPPWQFARDSAVFEFRTTHLAKTNKLHLDLATGEVLVEVMPKGFLATFHGLHFFNGRVPNAPFFLKTWIIYQWMGLFVLLVSMILGLWLWVKYSYQTWELYVFGGLFFLSILIMYWI